MGVSALRWPLCPTSPVLRCAASMAMLRLKAACERWVLSAARVKLPLSARVMQWRNWACSKPNKRVKTMYWTNIWLLH